MTLSSLFFFFFNDTATTEIYTLSLHDALPIYGLVPLACAPTQIAGRNRMMRRLAMDAIKADPAWNGGEYTSPPVLGLRGAVEMLWIMGTAPIQQHAQAPTRDAAD